MFTFAMEKARKFNYKGLYKLWSSFDRDTNVTLCGKIMTTTDGATFFDAGRIANNIPICLALNFDRTTNATKCGTIMTTRDGATFFDVARIVNNNFYHYICFLGSSEEAKNYSCTRSVTNKN